MKKIKIQRTKNLKLNPKKMKQSIEKCATSCDECDCVEISEEKKKKLKDIIEHHQLLEIKTNIRIQSKNFLNFLF